MKGRFCICSSTTSHFYLDILSYFFISTYHYFLKWHLCLFLVLLSVKDNMLTSCELKLIVTINCITDCWVEYLACHSECVLFEDQLNASANCLARQLRLSSLLLLAKYMPVVLASNVESFPHYCDDTLKVCTCSWLLASWSFRAVISPTVCEILSWMYYVSSWIVC